MALFWLALPTTHASESTALASTPTVTRDAYAVAIAPSRKLASTDGLAPMLVLDALDAASIKAIVQRNESVGTLQQNGVARQVKTPSVVTIDSSHRSVRENQLIRSVDDKLIWSASIHVDDAFAYRLALHRVNLPSGTLAWVYNESGQELGPLLVDQLLFEGTVWLPALNGETQYLELALPAPLEDQATIASFEIGEVMELLDLQAARQAFNSVKTWQECDIPVACVDASTFPATEAVRRATALLFFIKNGASFLCSGGLVASTGPQDEYLLTANHCFSTQREASTLSAYFDYYDDQCAPPGVGQLGALPQVHGARLRASGLQSDFTLVALNDPVPGMRSYLGWSTAPLDFDQTLFRHAYPEGMTQRFTMSSVLDDSAQQCPGLAPPQFIYSQDLAGSTTGGSSGALLLNADGLIVGQLLGACPLVSNYSPCRYDEFYNLDGAFTMTYPHVAQWLDPAAFFPDTTVVDFATSVLNPAVGEPMMLSASVLNQGLEPAPATSVQWYVSSDELISADDVLLGETDVGPLQHEQTETVAQGVTVDSAGRHFVGVCVSAVAAELVIGNQCSNGVALVVGHSDLQLVGLEPLAVEEGALQLSAVVENIGDVASDVIHMAFYSSQDQQLDTLGVDHLLGEQPVPSLAPGESSTATLTIDWQPTAPQWLASCAGSDEFELRVENNCSEMILPPLTVMTAEMMGIWALGNQPRGSPGAGASLQLLGTDDGSHLLAGVVFDYLEGMPRWSVFTAALTGSTELEFELLNYAGADFPPRFDSDDVFAQPAIAADLKFIGPTAGFLQVSDADGGDQLLPMQQLHAQSAPNLSHACLAGAYAFADLEPGRPGHGLVVEILQIEGVEHLALSWYAFVDGLQVFIVGAAPIVNGEANTEAYWYRRSDDDPARIEAVFFGTMTFRSTGPGTAEFGWTSTAAGFSSGSSDLRLIGDKQDCMD